MSEKVIVIENCTDCPYHKIEYTANSTNKQLTLCCTKLNIKTEIEKHETVYPNHDCPLENLMDVLALKNIQNGDFDEW